MSFANIGQRDRTFRIVVGMILIVAPFFSGLAIFDNQVLRIIVSVIGAILLFSGLIRFCLVNMVLGMLTRR